MNKLISMLMGDEKNARPAKRYAVIAALATAAALLVAVVILIVSSIIFSVADDDASPAVPSGDGGDDIGISAPVGSSVQYASTTADALDEKVDRLVSFIARSDREITKGTNDLYYAQNGVEKLSKGTMNAAHKMFVDFYNNNKSALKTDVGADSSNKECTIPLVIDESSDGTSFKVVVFGNDATTYNNKTYSWLYTNAAKYGFVTEENKFTYVGVAAAGYINKLNPKTLAALVTRLSAPNASAVDTSAAEIGAAKTTAYRLYYLAADAELKAPTNYEYEVFKNGTEGYIIVVNMSKKVTSGTAAAQ